MLMGTLSMVGFAGLLMLSRDSVGVPHGYVACILFPVSHGFNCFITAPLLARHAPFPLIFNSQTL